MTEFKQQKETTMSRFKSISVAVALAAALVFAAVAPRFGVAPLGDPLAQIVAPAAAQPYPINSPFYIPAAIGPQYVIPVAQGSSYVFQTNGVNTLYFRILGAPTGLAALLQGTEARTPTTVSATVTMTSASPAVITWTNHGLQNNAPVVFTTTGALYTGLTAGTTYYVLQAGLTSSAFEVAATPGGAAINTSGSQSGTQTGTSTGVQWSNIPVDQIGGARLGTISAVGLYKANVAGFAQVQLNVSALTSGVTSVDASASQGPEFVRQLQATRRTYSAASLIATGGTTHFLSIAGSATTTVRVIHVACGGTATAAALITVTAEVDSTADSGDAGTALTGTPNDSGNTAATAVVLKHTTSPTSGTLVGLVRAGALLIGLTPTATNFPSPTNLAWDFGTRSGEQELVLRGVAQSFSLNASAAFGSGASVGCEISWTEE